VRVGTRALGSMGSPRGLLRNALLICCVALADAQDTAPTSETLESLGIGSGSVLAEAFATAAGQDGILSEAELASFERSGSELIRAYPFAAPFEATLYAGSDCTGSSREVTSASNETRCAECFDACGEVFDSEAPMATASATGTTSSVRSLRVSAGAVVLRNLCLGTYNYGVPGEVSVRTTQDGCVSFDEGLGPAHVAAVPLELRELVAAVFLKTDRKPIDYQLDTVEATSLGVGPLLESADMNGDGVLNLQEYATLLVRDLARREAQRSFMSASSMEDAAVAAAQAAAAGRDDQLALSQAEREAEALRVFGDAYAEAEGDPADGVTTPVPLDPQGRPIVTGGTSSADYGDVRDTSAVEGAYNPQMDGDVMMCVDGKQFQAGLCFDFCRMDHPVATLNMCWKEDCPGGYKEIAGNICKKEGLNLKTQVKGNYERAKGVLPSTCRLGDSFGPGANPDDGNRDFTVLMVSDTQLPWCSGDLKKDVPCAMEENFRIVQGLHAVQKLVWFTDGNGTAPEVAEPLGVFITGDLTAYAHEWQFGLYRQIWETREGEDRDKNVKLPVWPGIGNHDYANNLEGCYFITEEPTWTGYVKNSCAQRMVAYIRAAVAKCGGQTVLKNFGGRVDHYDKESAGYTVRYGRIRFVHLHNYPTFRRSELVGVASTMNFLKDEVAEADRTGDYLVLLIHDLNGHFAPWPGDDQVERYHYFSEVVAGSRTLAVFSGHFHQMQGQKSPHNWQTLWDSRYNAALLNAFGEEVPSIRSSAPDYSGFVVTQWNVARCFWRFGFAQVPGKEEPKGDPSWKGLHDEGVDPRLQQTFAIPNCTIDEDYSPPAGLMVSGSLRAFRAFQTCALLLPLMASLLWA